MPGIAFGPASYLPNTPKRVVERLMAPDMWTGWGIRTLSADHVAFNPYNYQTGSVWPHDNAIIAMGFKRYGFHAEAAQIAHDVSVAASHFLLKSTAGALYRLRAQGLEFPGAVYGCKCAAWAAGAVFMLTQALLGFLPDAPHNKLYICPHLPAWLPDLTMHDLRIGENMLDIQFWREAERTLFDVIKGDRKLVERRNIAANGAKSGTVSELIQMRALAPARGNNARSEAV